MERKIMILEPGVASFEEIASFEMEAGGVLKGALAGKKISDDAKLAILAVKKVLDHNKVKLSDWDRSRIGIVLNSAFGCLESYERFYRSCRGRKPEPSSFACSLPSVPASIISLAWRITGPCFTMVSADPFSMDSVEYGRDIINWGICDLIFAGGWFKSSCTSERWHELQGQKIKGGRARIFLLQKS